MLEYFGWLLNFVLYVLNVFKVFRAVARVYLLVVRWLLGYSDSLFNCC